MIRKATYADTLAVLDMARPWFEESDFPLIFDEGETAMRFHEQLAGGGYVFVWEEDGDIAALAALDIRNTFFTVPEGRIEMFFVRKAYRKTGIAQCLAKYCHEFAIYKNAGIINVDTYFAKHSRVFANMFKKLGYEQTGYCLTWVKS